MIIDVNEGEDHEGIYLKTKYSTVLNNQINNGGSGDGDITVKGGVYTEHMIIANNIVESTQQGRGILLYGGGIIDGNYIRKPNALRSGIQYWACMIYNASVSRNYIEQFGNGLRLEDVVGGGVNDNYLISYEYEALRIDINTLENPPSIKNEYECEGYDCLTKNVDEKRQYDFYTAPIHF